MSSVKRGLALVKLSSTASRRTLALVALLSDAAQAPLKLMLNRMRSGRAKFALQNQPSHMGQKSPHNKLRQMA